MLVSKHVNDHFQLLDDGQNVCAVNKLLFDYTYLVPRIARCIHVSNHNIILADHHNTHIMLILKCAQSVIEFFTYVVLVYIL